MIDSKGETQKQVIRRQVFEFSEKFGSWNTDTWTRVEVNGELEKWIPHDAYGEMPSPNRASQEVKQKLEQIYRTHD